MNQTRELLYHYLGLWGMNRSIVPHREVIEASYCGSRRDDKAAKVVNGLACENTAPSSCAVKVQAGKRTTLSSQLLIGDTCRCFTKVQKYVPSDAYSVVDFCHASLPRCTQRSKSFQ
ncbi:uncharacterized protein PV07_11563 [Cladophialophora immunda]|uniref:Uncharacterized protein n=1 Tax=Cladophialophora immunda TaxID=569365 RepID=A0A0D1Z6W1_9EURO|nr:uncharacterized protein PV07_11563 [Cladophialophora immunda]KIW23356.1 hypothetical protein PV07_11563 [Cladophialophora immunda]